MAIIVTAPKEYYGVYRSKWPSIFLAGGITGCADWQNDILLKLMNENAIIYNPRRANFPIGDPDAAEVQITWEFDKLEKAHIVSFWFACGTDDPIVLYELGLHGNSRPDRPIFIGIENGYSRTPDVIIQTALARPEIVIANSLHELAGQIKNILK